MAILPIEIDADIARAFTLPADVYHAREYYDLQRSRVFSRTWQVVADAGRVRAPGHVLPFTLLPGCLDEPLVVTRDDGGSAHCMSNVCTHRGALVVEGEGHVKTLRCR
nr:Rieske 2Fe-2S domain-containing protein [Acidobacteriota bacterium]